MARYSHNIFIRKIKKLSDIFNLHMYTYITQKISPKNVGQYVTETYLVRIQVITVFFRKQFPHCNAHCKWNNCNAECTSRNFTEPWRRRKWRSRQAENNYQIHLIIATNIKIYKGITSPDVSSLIADKRHSLFGHMCRLPKNTPASQALQLSIEAHTGTPPAADWKRPPGRPQTN